MCWGSTAPPLPPPLLPRSYLYSSESGADFFYSVTDPVSAVSHAASWQGAHMHTAASRRSNTPTPLPPPLRLFAAACRGC